MQHQDESTFLSQVIAHIRPKLPIQNPLHSYVHNNILQMFEGKDFHEALAEAGGLYRARPYWPVFKYTEKFQEGKITELDVFKGIEQYSAHYPAINSVDKMGITSKEYFYRLMFSELAFNEDEIQPNIKNQHLWSLCQDKIKNETLTLGRSKKVWRGKEYWEKYHNESYSVSLQPLVIRLISSYLDQGQSYWSNPFHYKGFWPFFVFDILSMKGFSMGWRDHLLEKVKFYQDQSSLYVIETELKAKGIPEDVWEDYLLEILFDLKGWSGMVNKLELEPWQATVKAPNIKLEDYIAALLLTESAMDDYHTKEHSLDLSLIQGRTEAITLKSFQLTLALYQITTSFKLEERWMQRLDTNELLEIIDQVDSSESRDRVRLWAEAYEHHFHREAIEALHVHQAVPAPQKAYAQVLFCIDDREESIRRHLEEADTNVITYGVVGFFGIDMKFSSLKNKRLIAQCPPVISPSRIITEVPKGDSYDYGKRNIQQGGGNLSLYYNSRTLFRGFFSTIIFGFLSIFPMISQIFFPRESKVWKKKLYAVLNKEPETEMSLELGEEGHGYSKAEMGKIVHLILSMCGFKPDMSDLVVIMGHGSSSSNNPFKQSYGCGACGGNAGIPNSRAFAKMGNDPEVRNEVLKLGMKIPDSTFFVSGFHDTCTDEALFFNEKEIPQNQIENFKKIQKSLALACASNAFERCQRFSSFPKNGTTADAVKHVRDRANDIAQPRPEYGHCTNALAIVGKRDMTKGLFLNRRAFLLTYDWENDVDGEVLKNVVIGGVPVCVNINMDYYFSCVDNENFGCGSKLPLNATSLLGVMTGSQSDLRIGMARQMVEIHEPIRNLTLIEAPLGRVQKLFDSHPRLRNILYHHWFRLVVKDPETNDWWMFGEKDFFKLEFENKRLKHFNSTLDLIDKINVHEDFAEIN